MCCSLVKGAWPIHGVPSAPMCVKVEVLRSIHTAMKWQPMPAVARGAPRAPGGGVGGGRRDAGGGGGRGAGGEVGLADRGDARLRHHLFLEIEERQSLAELRAELRGHAELLEALRDRLRHHGGGALAVW